MAFSAMDRKLNRFRVDPVVCEGQHAQNIPPSDMGHKKAVASKSVRTLNCIFMAPIVPRMKKGYTSAIDKP